MMRTVPYRLQPIWIAFKRTDVMCKHYILNKCRQLEDFFELDDNHVINVTLTQSCGLISINFVNEMLGIPAYHIDDDSHSCAGCFLHAIEESESSGVFLKQLAKRLSHGRADFHLLPPPVAYAHHDMLNDSLLGANDFFGSGKIYYSESCEQSIYGTSLAAVALFKGDAPVVNNKSWCHYFGFDWLLDDETFFTGIKLLPPGCKFSISASNAWHKETHSYSILKNNEQLTNIATDDAINASLSLLKKAENLSTSGSLTMGLTGGRDSRLIAAMSSYLDLDIAFFTQHPPMLEKIIAEQLVNASNNKIEWTTMESRAPENINNLDDITERGIRAFFYYEGDTWPSGVGKPIMSLSKNLPNVTKVALSGAAGELVKANAYTLKDLGNEEAKINSFINYKKRHLPFLKQDTISKYITTLEQIFDDGKANGFHGLKLLDWFFVRSQQRRRVPSSFQINNIFPLYTPHLFWAGFNRDPLDKINAKLIADITNKLKPEWSNIPYFAEVAHKYSANETSKTLSSVLYWEADRNSYLEQLFAGIELASEYISEEAKDMYANVQRGAKNASQLHNFSNRVFWYVGFDSYQKRLTRVLGDEGSTHANVLVNIFGDC